MQLQMEEISTKSAICRDAVRAFAEKGYESTSMDEVAAHLGVAKGTIYYHFKGKRQLFAAMLSDGLDRLLGEMERAVACVTDPLEQLSRVIDVLFEFQRKHADFVRLLVREALTGGSKRPAEAAERWRPFTELIESIVADGKAAGRIRDIETVAVTRYILGTLATITFDWPRDETSAGILRGIKGMMLSGIACNGGTADVCDCR